MKKSRLFISCAAALTAVCAVSAGAYAQTVVDFEDGNYSFVSMKTDDGGDDSKLSVTDFNGSKQLKVDVTDCANVPKVAFDINSILDENDFDKVKTIEMEITFESKEKTTPPGWAGGAVGTQGGENSPAWAQTSWEGGEYENPVSEPITVQRKFLLSSEKFVNGTENTQMLLMRWGADVNYNMYVDNIRFLDDEGKEIKLALVSAPAAETEKTEEVTEAVTEPEPDETEAVPDEESAEETEVKENEPESDEKTTSATTGNAAAAAAATAVVISGYAVAMTKRKEYKKTNKIC